MLAPNAFSLPKAIRAPRSRFPLKNSQRYFHVFILCFPPPHQQQALSTFFSLYFISSRKKAKHFCADSKCIMFAVPFCVYVCIKWKNNAPKNGILIFQAYKILWIKLPRESTVQLLISISAPKFGRPAQWHQAPGPQFIAPPMAAPIFRQQSPASSSTYLVNVQILRRHYSTPRTIFR